MMKWAMKRMLAVVIVSLLAGCGDSDSASYFIHGPIHSLTLLRTKQFLWSKDWQMALVTTRNPECMRRHKLLPAPDIGFKTELFRSLEGNYILRQGNNWYVTETQKCQLQQFKLPPREPGDLLGTFNEKEGEGVLQFIAAPKPGGTLSATIPPPRQEAPVGPAKLPATAPVTR